MPYSKVKPIPLNKCFPRISHILTLALLLSRSKVKVRNEQLLLSGEFWFAFERPRASRNNFEKLDSFHKSIEKCLLLEYQNKNSFTHTTKQKHPCSD